MSGPVLRVANCSGFYGDRLSAAREMVEGGPIDVLTGDWLAELTMLILAGNRLKGRPGYAPTFLRQLEDVLGTCLERGIKIVSNAGGLDPAGCADAVRELAARLGLSARVAHVAGDDLTGRDLDLVNADTGERLTATPLTANAYLGGRPIAAALSAGADVVVTGRVTDAALVTGPGIWRYGWGPDDLDALAGSVVAGHVIECGCQATGGNYAFFQDVPDLAHCGFPIAELHADGSSVITKHPGTGGLVSVGTVTAQLLYEIAGPRYAGPDVVARFDTISLSSDGPDRVRVSGVRGEPPPGTLKVAVNYLAGYRNTMTLVLTGLDLADKARVAEETIWARVPKDSFDQVDVTLTGHGLLRITVMDAERDKAGRAFSSAVVETGLAGYPGFYGLNPPGPASPYGVYWPVLVPASEVRPEVYLDGERIPLDDPGGPTARPLPEPVADPGPAPVDGPVDGPVHGPVHGPTVRMPLGRIAGARSGDKGGNANLGVWTTTPERHAWLAAHLTVERLKSLLPELAPYRVERHLLPNLNALNFVVHGLLGRGVAASTRMDAQAKALGEELRACPVDVPERLG
ncbi:acyclic terpene utilization AtuA family protein [Nonomuraea sp. NPDC048826]|uniref:acyclic terpene utilization AtuA family protein n=1 Tax=Nonomuraea sp. NPDC048826 TaxID=3364347 RepID=UPI0037142989